MARPAGVLKRAALHDRQRCPRRRPRALQPRAVARRAGADRPGPRRDPRAPTSSSPRRACGFSRSQRATSTTTAMDAALADPMAAVEDLLFVALVGIIDPLRAEAKDAVRVRARRRHRRPHDHRRSHRDRAGDRRSARSRPRRHHRHRAAAARPMRRSSQRLPQLHVFGRVAPEDKVRLARLMQEAGRGRRDDRRRGQRRRGAEAGRRRRRDGQRLGGDQASRRRSS